MAEHYKGLVDAYGRPIEKAVLTQEIAAPSITGVRSVVTGYPGDGLTPARLASILRAADSGDPVRYLELAEQIEERDLHYSGVLGTRKRSVTQIDMRVEAASDKKEDVELADMVRDWLKRLELQDELFDVLDGLGKGYSFTEIMWDRSEGQWYPGRLEWRDPRWFRFDPVDGVTPLLRTEGGDQPVPPFKFIYARLKAKSGLPIRSGIARLAAWAWLFKAFTLRDWAIFTQTYGQPVRVGKYGAGATKEDKETLFRAVANIAGDCAAIIPDSMLIEFIEGKDVKGGGDLYEKRADWWDRQVSKAILGQTATTDAEVGGLGSGKEHREVQEDIERADAKALSAIINRDLVRPWIDLERGPQKRYPTLIIERPEATDLEKHSNALSRLVPLGLRIAQSEVRDRFGWTEPKPGEEILGAPAPAPAETPAPEVEDDDEDEDDAEAALQARGRESKAIADILADRLQPAGDAAIGAWLARIEAMANKAEDMDELREMLRAAFDDLDSQELADALGDAMSAADAAGRYDVEQSSA